MSKVKFSYLLIILVTTSCSSNFTSKWSCRKTEGDLGCVKISEADKAFDSSNTNLNSSTKDDDKSLSKIPSNSGSDINPQNQSLVRTQDKVGRVWIAPYLDTKNNWHEASYVRVVDEFARWEVRDKSTSAMKAYFDNQK